VTLSCADSQAQIFYTTDGTAPIPPANASDPANTAQLYNGPFQLPVSGMLLSALAWERTKLPSNIVRAVVTF